MRALIVVAGLLVVGCSTTWSRPLTPVAQQERDEAECRMLARGIYPNTGGLGGAPGGLMIIAGLAQQSEILQDCMKSKGYVPS